MASIINRNDKSERRRELRRDSTLPERKIWKRIRNRALGGLKFRRQVGIGPYIVDFYCAKRRLVIEIDGESHFTPEGVAYDAERTAYLESLNNRVLRFTNADVMENIDAILERIHAFIKTSPPLLAKERGQG
ncbi:hypothetical protein A2856_03845 [Candidatus Uhrbacteria bacterium RIFCSPHIGHO2_01_FULL_63_20]|uniref:DUF559 domain-containing protein n=1 Tax=Candidatus Uhrbacteria bacterium RIFCSPHIGHO2_01_FULL_63_20 TaxID=1802385 RepID=A0A1F7TME9_9BACT|nr:MAG: hypothetical protein A2856_03845 [Candidatus Uhrbacteria bacterium RIFCSPHIGHO2_01_FULL_63_20]